MQNINSAIKRFQLSDYETMRPLVIIEAESEEHALQRCRIVAPLIEIDDRDIYAVAEHAPNEAVVTPYFTDGYFQLLEAAKYGIH